MPLDNAVEYNYRYKVTQSILGIKDSERLLEKKRLNNPTKNTVKKDSRSNKEIRKIKKPPKTRSQTDERSTINPRVQKKGSP